MPNGYANSNYYKKGEWNAICDVCGFKLKSGQMRKRWDGLMVCDSDWEMDHPQKYLRVREDRQTVPWVRDVGEPGSGGDVNPANQFGLVSISSGSVDAGGDIVHTFTFSQALPVAIVAGLSITGATEGTDYETIVSADYSNGAQVGYSNTAYVYIPAGVTTFMLTIHTIDNGSPTDIEYTIAMGTISGTGTITAPVLPGLNFEDWFQRSSDLPGTVPQLSSGATWAGMPLSPDVTYTGVSGGPQHCNGSSLIFNAFGDGATAQVNVTCNNGAVPQAVSIECAFGATFTGYVNAGVVNGAINIYFDAVAQEIRVNQGGALKHTYLVAAANFPNNKWRLDIDVPNNTISVYWNDSLLAFTSPAGLAALPVFSTSSGNVQIYGVNSQVNHWKILSLDD